ncbi:DUF418 domain-containing protein [Epidermidibacterium keratini]|uniref:DUF418 domain-containing protein n=1 Tax=Epidermidibacterium keratini TaxID=1891644 RepID=A0A7L4YML5_9ACTN|nr:DUF418 domain-containing protein [Epidermidibacterium keratini]QHC00515.1 DUF418 domain-containing protein [Epidermidibacterium keratini]
MRRIATLDVLRGVALAGILTVNAIPLLITEPSGEGNPVSLALSLWVQERFFPIFSLLFGIGFGLMMLSAERRGLPARPALARRFGFLLVLGALHQILQPGEALLPYAVCGLALLLPASFLPRWAIAALAVPALVAAVMVGGMLAIPAMFLIGYALVQYGVIARLTGPGAVVTSAGLLAVVAVATPPLLSWLAAHPAQIGFHPMSAAAGLVMALGYVCLVVLAMNTPLKSALSAVFTPLGRMALTNYLGATLLLWAIMPFTTQLGIADSTDGMLRMLGVCLGILIAQWIFSTLWLRRFGQGPVEKLWRQVTWGRPRWQDEAKATGDAAWTQRTTASSSI